MTAPPMDPMQPMQPPVMPWTPFAPMPTDTEPLIAAMRRRKLGRLIDSAKFEAMDPTWQQVAIQEYERMREVESQAAQQAAMAAQPQKPQPKQEPQPGATP